VRVADEAGAWGVFLAQDDVADDAEARLASCLHEAVGLRPAIEADGEAVVLQDAVHLGEGGSSQSALSSLAIERPLRSL